MSGKLVSIGLLLAILSASGVALGAKPRAGGAEALVLRLSDIGKGYGVGDDSGCGGLGTENAPPSVAQIVVTYRPEGCAMDFERRWADRRETPAKGARLVESVAFVFPSPDGAAAAFRAGGEFARYVLLDPEGLAPSAEHLSLGDEATVFSGGRHFTILWRRAGVVALIHVHGQSAGRAKQAALALARLQEARIEKPAPVPAGANDDREVALDDPRLGIPVYWLGRRFTPGHRVPSLALAGASGNREPEEGYGMAATIEYGGPNAGVVLDLWKPKRWARFAGSRLGRQGSWNSPCARSRIVRLRRGHAELFGGYAPRERPPAQPVPVSGHTFARPAARCPKRARDDFIAHVYLPRVVVAVNMPPCLRCDTESGSYESFRALTAVVRGLRLRRR